MIRGKGWKFSKSDLKKKKNQTTDPRCLPNSEPDKYIEKHTKAYHSQNVEKIKRKSWK